LSGFERLRSIIDLCDQMEEYSLRAHARWHPHRLKNVNAVFSVYRGGQTASLMRPYPFDPHAIQRLVYGQGTTSWVTATSSLIRRKFGEFIARHTLSEFWLRWAHRKSIKTTRRRLSCARRRRACRHARYNCRSNPRQPPDFFSRADVMTGSLPPSLPKKPLAEE